MTNLRFSHGLRMDADAAPAITLHSAFCTLTQHRGTETQSFSKGNVPQVLLNFRKNHEQTNYYRSKMCNLVVS